MAQGDDTTLNVTASVSLPNGDYLISVWADGFKIDGGFFSVPFKNVASTTTPGVVTVKAQPYPLPLATVKLQVFEDRNPVNGQFDQPGEENALPLHPPMQNFVGHLSDVLGEVTNDWYGNPLCTVYQTDANGAIVLDANDKPTIVTPGGKCLSGADGVITIPNMGPNRYTASVVAPTGTNWVQTTTLEGNHDWDVWVSEGATGYDIEQIGPNGEPVPAIPFGFVKPLSGSNNSPTTGTSATTGAIKGLVMATKTYIPQINGLPYTGGTPGTNAQGSKFDVPINRPWIALNDLQGGDTPVYIGRGNSDGTFQINNVPDGDYALAYWDDAQDFLLDFLNVTVANGQLTNMGTLTMAGWWTSYYGRVCQDNNGNGKCDPGEPGIANQTVQLLSRANNTLERGISSVTTDNNGNYLLREAYPLTSWYEMQVYNDRFKTVGVTYQADNQPSETTFMGSMVDVSVFPVIGLSGRLDWAVQPYDYTQGENGGIVGTVYYDTTRNELDARYAAAEAYQPGIPGLTVQLYSPVPCGTNPGATCDANNRYEVDATGAYKTRFLLNTYTTEAWNRPTGCVPLDVTGTFIQQQITPRKADGSLDTDKDCIEAPFMGVQFDPNASQVNGNYGFSTMQRDPITGKSFGRDANNKLIEKPLIAGDYLVKVIIPKDASGKDIYKVTKEEDINVFTGDQFTPQVPPQPCAGALHTVDVKGIGTDGPNAVDNPGFAAVGGSPYEGQQKPLCDTRLVTVQVGKSVAPSFFMFTDVPIPGKLWGLINDDVNLSTNPQDIMYGEKRGLANVPIGVYDFSNRLITTVMSDPNGFYELLLPSTSTYNCPLPAGPCPNVYRLVGNDPGTPGNLNPYYNPQYRTISASFEVWPGEVMPADHAPIPIGAATVIPGSQQNQLIQCKLDSATPQLFQIERPYTSLSDSALVRTITIQGDGFGATQGAGSVMLGNTSLQVKSWNNQTIKVQIPATGITPGPYQLTIKSGNGQTTPEGITFHVLGNGYNPNIIEVGVGKKYDPTKYSFPYLPTNYKGPLQAALDEAAATPGKNLVVVYPGDDNIPVNKHGASVFNANGAYFENVVIHSAVKLQGIGPGGIRADGSTVKGVVIDGQSFGNENYGDAWRTRTSALPTAGNNANLYEGAVVTVLPPNRTAFNNSATNNFAASIDGFQITGGDQMGQNTKNNSLPGGIVVTQGGGIYVSTFARFLQITNNLVRSNGGAYAGGIRIGTPYYTAPNNPAVGSANTDMHIAYNRIVANGGTNLAGGIGIFNGSDNYEIDHNDVCGNYSGEYGGGISQYGYSPNGKIHDNRVYFNNSFDEGGGIKLGGELPPNPATSSKGTGPEDIYNNLIQDNLANDDGGGIRLLMVENFQVNIYNNIIANNISTHEGGGISLDDAPQTAIYNNTIVKNITTATASTSDGKPAPAGISTAANSKALPAPPNFSDPLLFNNLTWDNRAGSWDSTNLVLTGIGQPGDTAPINYWDMGVAGTDATQQLHPTNSIYQTATSSSNNPVADPTNTTTDPTTFFKDNNYNISVAVFPWRTQATFVGATIVAVELPPNLMGNYHLAAGSPAINVGATSKTYRGMTVNAPGFDYDNQPRPQGSGVDIGADEAQ